MKCVKPITFQKGRVVYKVACGQCIGCRINKSEEWSMRLKHELLCNKKAVFVTLTYDDKNYSGESLRKRDAQLFIKKLRRYYEGVLVIRYFLVGEYGGTFGRPHYHCILFGLSKEDEINIERSWGFGFVQVVNANIQTIKYVSKYVVGAAKGELRKQMLRDGIHPEFSIMSLKPGIGRLFADKYLKGWVENGRIINDGIKCKIPRYYISKLSEEERKKYSQRKIDKGEEVLQREARQKGMTDTEIKIRRDSELKQLEKNIKMRLRMERERKNGKYN